MKFVKLAMLAAKMLLSAFLYLCAFALGVLAIAIIIKALPGLLNTHSASLMGKSLFDFVLGLVAFAVAYGFWYLAIVVRCFKRKDKTPMAQ